MSNSKDKEDLAKERTDFAEDRTLLANERTFSSWMGTGLTSVGVGAGFHVLFSKVEPTLLPKMVASLLILVGVVVFLAAERRSGRVRKRLNESGVEPSSNMNMRIIAWTLALASILLLITLWFFY